MNPNEKRQARDKARTTAPQSPPTMSAATTTTSPPLSWPLPPQSRDVNRNMTIADFGIDLENLSNYDLSLPMPDLALEDDCYGTPFPLGDEASSSAAHNSEPYLSEGSPMDDSSNRQFSSHSASASASRIANKEDLEQNPHLREAIQTVSEYRKLRRRAQNRTAQQAFKERKKLREQELTAQIDAVERNFKELQEENQQLREDLERKQIERSKSMARRGTGARAAAVVAAVEEEEGEEGEIGKGKGKKKR